MKFKNGKKWAVGILAVLALAAVVSQTQKVIRNGEITRNKAGAGDRQEEIVAKTDGKEYRVTVDVSEQKLTQKEVEELFKKTKKEIDETFPGENSSVEHITKPVVMRETYQDGLVKAAWYVDRTDMVDMDGKLLARAIPKKGVLINAEAWLSYGENQEIYRFSFKVYPSKQTMAEKLKQGVQRVDEKTAEKPTLKLPQKIAGKEVRWKEKNSHITVKLLFFSVIVWILVQAAQIEKRRAEEKKREEELLFAYPQMVSAISVLLGAGMPISKAWERLVTQYRNRNGKKEVLYEEMAVTWHEIQSGVGEKRAYENFGRRCNLPPYKKMVSIITQNLRKGSRSIATLLEKEAENARNQRKNEAKKRGEQAGTKMLLPMMMMLGIVMVIVLVPALISL